MLLIYVITSERAVSIFAKKGFGEMKHAIWRRTVQIVLVLALVMSVCLPMAGAEPEPGPEAEPTIDETKLLRVGLAYGSGVLVSANLQNVTGNGSGYRFGYYNSDLSFVELGWTEQIKISMLETQNVYLDSSNSYTRTVGSLGAVGCYHVQLPGSYSDYESAKAAADSAGGFVAWIGGTYYVRSGSYVSRSGAAEAAAAYEGASVGETTGSGVSVVTTGTNQILFQFDDEGQGTGLGVEPDLTDAKDRQTWFKGFRYRGGFRFQRINGGDLTVVNIVPLGDYVKGVVPYEASSSWPIEALKAQAVCARTYALFNLNKHRTHGCDVCTSVDCQVYQGVNKEAASTVAAVEETAGVTLKYNGKYIDAVFSSSDGGATEAAKNVWGTDYPYLQGVVDPYEADVAGQISDYNWKKSITGAELQAKLIANGRTGCGVIKQVTINKTEMGNVYSMTFTDVNGKNWTVYRGNCRTYFGFRSQRFDLADAPASGGGGNSVYVNGSQIGSTAGLYAIDGSGAIGQLSGTPYIITASGTQALDGGASGSDSSTSSGTNGVFTFRGSGWGHNVGMSQWGAYSMAKQGFTYTEILTFYYTGVTVER